jgi:hypothetical protein
MTNFVFGLLIALFIFIGLVILALVYLDGQLTEMGALALPEVTVMYGTATK